MTAFEKLCDILNIMINSKKFITYLVHRKSSATPFTTSTQPTQLIRDAFLIPIETVRICLIDFVPRYVLVFPVLNGLQETFSSKVMSSLSTGLEQSLLDDGLR